MTDDRHDTGTTEGLERKIAELRLAGAQMEAERDEHARNAARATTVRDGLHALHHELDLLASERATTAEAAKRQRDEAEATLERLAHRASERAREIADLEAERAAAETSATAAAAAEATAREQHDETARSAADLRAKLAAAASEATLAETRRVQFIDIARTLEREQAAAEAALATIRARYESTRLKANLDRIKTLETRLASEREALERRLHDLHTSPTPSNSTAAHVSVSEPAEAPAVKAPSAREIPRVSLADRLARDFEPGK